MTELALPHVPQTTMYTCGPASLASVLRYYGHRVTERGLARRAGTTPCEGTPIAGMLAAARSYGVEPWVYERLRYDWLRDLNDTGYPVIALVQAWHDGGAPAGGYAESWDDGHYVVVTEATAHEVVMMDPSQTGARSVLATADWLDRWHDIDVGRQLRNAVIVFPMGTVRRRRVGRTKAMG